MQPGAVKLKSGHVETYTRNNAKSMAVAKKKWGKLPTTPPRVTILPTFRAQWADTTQPRAEADSTNLPDADTYQQLLKERLAHMDDSLHANADAQLAHASKQYALKLEQYKSELKQYEQEKRTLLQQSSVAFDQTPAQQSRSRQQKMMNQQKALFEYQRA